MDNLILLASGNLGLIALKNIISKTKLDFVFTDKGSIHIIQYCSDNGVPFYAGNPRLEKAKQVISSLKCSVLLSVNYLFIVEADFLSIASDYAINFHGSLLPKYRGRTPHVWAIINGEKETGVTAHLMTGEVDNGPIVLQRVMNIDDSDTGYSILNKFNELYPQMIDTILNDINSGNISPKGQDHSKATYFSKRTLEDGEINWEWQKERVRNWVRAQADPYPGAFSFYEGEKLIIHEISFDDLGFHCDDENGLVLQGGEHPIIKTPNGAIRLLKFEIASHKKIEKGKLLCRKLK
jgi:methionyl-tRNA formyltransferase